MAAVAVTFKSEGLDYYTFSIEMSDTRYVEGYVFKWLSDVWLFEENEPVCDWFTGYSGLDAEALEQIENEISQVVDNSNKKYYGE